MMNSNLDSISFYDSWWGFLSEAKLVSPLTLSHSWHITWFVTRVIIRLAPLVTSGEGTVLPPPPGFSGFCVAGSLVFCVVYCRLLFVLLSLFFWSLCCFLRYNFWLPLWCLPTFLPRIAWFIVLIDKPVIKYIFGMQATGS